jgi:hypothetical protein
MFRNETDCFPPFKGRRRVKDRGTEMSHKDRELLRNDYYTNGETNSEIVRIMTPKVGGVPSGMGMRLCLASWANSDQLPSSISEMIFSVRS